MMGRGPRDTKGALVRSLALAAFGLVLACLLTGILGSMPVLAEPVDKKIPVTVKADKLDYDRTNDVYIAEGHVKVEQEGLRVEADKIVLNNKTGVASAQGHVYLQEKGDIVRAESLQININTKAGFIYKGDLFMAKDNLHLKGDKIERKSETVYRIENGTFTTCDEADWYLKADEINVDMDKYATGKDVSFRLGGVPVFYSPYLLFPVRRQSGLLIPEPGYNSTEGFFIKNSIFWAISDFQDMTFYSDYRARHGVGSGLEYRYVNSRDSAGKFYGNYFNTYSQYSSVNSPGTPDARWLLSYQHHEEIAEDLSVRADLNVVSDYAYFRDLERRLELRSVPYLDSNLFYVERWDTASLNLLGQYSIDLTKQDNSGTVQKLPELRYNIFEEQLAGPVRLNFEGTATNFSRQTGNDVMRADFNPRLSAAFGSGGLTFTPRLGAHATYYSVGAASTEPVERMFYYAGADLNARISRVYGTDSDAGFGRIRHSIEPTISYSYIPHLDQTDIPQLDAIDTITTQNLVTFSLINRFTAHYKDTSGFRTFDVVVFRLSESYNVGAERNPDGQTPARSAVTGELYVKTPKLLTLSATGTYDTNIYAFTSSSESAEIKTDMFRFNLSHQYLKENLALNQATTTYLIGGAGTKLGKWDIDFQLWRDMVLKTTTQQEYKVHYASQCWGLGLSYVKKPGETQYLLTLDLKGLGAFKF